VHSSITTHEHVQRMLDHIQRNYTRSVTLETLARTLARQSSYLGRLFREEIGVTVHEYVTRARMVNGAVQVRSGVKIEAVALDLGYQSKKNFYRQFKRHYGMTPEAYRHVHQQLPPTEPVGAGRSEGERCRDGHDRGAAVSQNSRPIGTTGRLDGSPRETAGRTSRLTLLAHQTMMRLLLGSRIAMLVSDSTGCYIGANRTAVSMTGYSVTELRGRPVSVLFPYVPRGDTRSRLQILLDDSSSLPANTVLHTKSAGPVRVHLTSALNLLEDGQQQAGSTCRSPM
jgi:PAS domain S-box-containing protein